LRDRHAVLECLRDDIAHGLGISPQLGFNDHQMTVISDKQIVDRTFRTADGNRDSLPREQRPVTLG